MTGHALVGVELVELVLSDAVGHDVALGIVLAVRLPKLAAQQQGAFASAAGLARVALTAGSMHGCWLHCTA